MPKKSVLIVEDNEEVRDSLALLLQAEGFKVITAENSASGFEKLFNHKPDVVITDILLPDYSGLEFIRWVRKQDQFVGLPVIAMTAFENGYLVAAQHLGADALIHKPEGLAYLSATITAVLTNRPQ